MNTNRPPSDTACQYIGGREGLAKALRRFTSVPLQIIDLVGSFALTLPQITAAASTSRESVIISTRRSSLNDELGHAESSLLAAIPNSIILRCAPLDLSIPLLWAWAQVSGILMSAFHSQGVAWIRTVDLAEAISRITAADIRTRRGRVYDVTGPDCVSMAQMRDLIADQLGEDIQLACLPPDAFAERLLANGMPDDVARWVAEYQSTSSNPELPATTSVLSALLGRAPSPPQLIPHEYQDRKS